MSEQVLFRFQGLEIWKRAIKIAGTLFDIADSLEKKRLYRFAEQLRGAGLSIPNNIAEGSGSVSRVDFKNFLNYARRSIYESANMLIIFRERGYIDNEIVADLLGQLAELSRMTVGFARAL